MKKKTGFTLIELLAVIVILAIIALIAVPVIMNIITKARKSAFEDTAYGLISAGEMYYAEKLLDAEGMTQDVEFAFSESGISASDNFSVLNVKGSIPKGKMTVTKDGKVAIAVQNGINCITKDYDDSAITTTDYVEGKCYFPGTLAYLATTNDIVTSVDACVTTGTCNVGAQIAIKVNDTETQTFRVISDASATGGKVVLQLEGNLGDTVAWISNEDYIAAGGVVTDEMLNDGGGCQYNGVCVDNAYGPITALEALEERTKEWTNLPKGYTTTDYNSPTVYSPITRSNARARLITEVEASTIISNDWAYSTSYWTSSAYSGSFDCVFAVISDYSSDYPEYISATLGIRPVIEIPKSSI